ncbi:hypothetical protein ACJ41O_014239 [Fusarium nematophilum]
MFWILFILLTVGTGSSFGSEIKVENLVTFGDSFTDSGRLAYFLNNNGKAPPAGKLPPEHNVTSSGGLAWAQFAARAIGAKHYNYAINGATCSSKIIDRHLAAINQSFPSVLEYQVPAYVADTALPALYKNRRADNTLYTLWIGCNDLGRGAFLTDTQTHGSTLSTFIDCLWTVFDQVYETGGRHFVLFNTAPMERSPLYKSIKNGGLSNSMFWQDKSSYNTTEYEQKMLQYTSSVNTMLDYGVPYQNMIRRRWPGATFTIFNANNLMQDLIAEPEKHFTAPTNITGFYNVCDPTGEPGASRCVPSKSPLSSFMWFDEMHPSERTMEIIAQHFLDAIVGNSAYGISY